MYCFSFSIFIAIKLIIKYILLSTGVILPSQQRQNAQGHQGENTKCVTTHL